jgi:hypothetical protein
VSQHLTVGQLLDALQGLDRDAPVRAAVNPDFPFAHHLNDTVQISDGVVYLADNGQHDYLPTFVSVALDWDRPHKHL